MIEQTKLKKNDEYSRVSKGKLAIGVECQIKGSNQFISFVHIFMFRKNGIGEIIEKVTVATYNEHRNRA